MCSRKYIFTLLIFTAIHCLSCIPFPVQSSRKSPSQNEPKLSAREQKWVESNEKYLNTLIQENKLADYMLISNDLFGLIGWSVKLQLIENQYQVSTVSDSDTFGIIKIKKEGGWVVSWSYDEEGYLEVKMLNENMDQKWDQLSSRKSIDEFQNGLYKEYDQLGLKEVIPYGEWLKIAVFGNTLQAHLANMRSEITPSRIQSKNDIEKILTDFERKWGVEFVLGLNEPVILEYEYVPKCRNIKVILMYKGKQVVDWDSQFSGPLTRGIDYEAVTGELSYR